MRFPLTVLALLALALALAACQPIQAPAESAPAPAEPAVAAQRQAAPQPATIVLPDGTVCLHAGYGATLAFDGKRVNYTCGEPDARPIVGLIGDVTQPTYDTLAVEVATIGHDDGGFTLDSSQELTFQVNYIALADGALCAHAGHGATLGFDDKRLNYTCGAADAEPIVGLIGDLVQEDGDVWLVERAVISRSDSGFVLDSSEMAVISVLDGSEGEGSSVAVDAAQSAVVDGVVTYRVRMALPPNAVVSVKLVDVSRMDAPAIVISEQDIVTEGRQVPIPFALPYDPAAIDERFTYAVQARIEADGQLLFISTRQYPVITRGNPTTVEVWVEQP